MTTLELLHLLTFPLVGAAIGWCTNYLAIKMLFRPREPRGVPGFRLQGLLPRRRAELAGRIGETVSRDLLSEEEISELLSRIHWEDEVRAILDETMKADLLPRLAQRLPVVPLVFSQMKELLAQRILRALHEHSGKIVTRFRGEIDLHRMVVEKLAAYDLDDLEKMVFSLVSRELRHIELVGGVLGFTVGAVQSLIFYLSRHG